MESNILIPIVALLSILTIGGTFLYRYLRQEQKKVIPEDKYNKAWADYNTKIQFQKQKHDLRWAVLIVLRLLIMGSTYISAIVLFIFVTTPKSDNDLLGSMQYAWFSATNNIILVAFPFGVALLLGPYLPELWWIGSWWIGYVLYLVILVLGMIAKDRLTFIIIYLIFITLLVMNAAGFSKLNDPT